MRRLFFNVLLKIGFFFHWKWLYMLAGIALIVPSHSSCKQNCYAPVEPSFIDSISQVDTIQQAKSEKTIVIDSLDLNSNENK